MADAMDQYFIDLIDREEQINLPAIVIRHIARIANTSREHGLGHGFLLTCVFEHFGAKLQKKVGYKQLMTFGVALLWGAGTLW